MIRFIILSLIFSSSFPHLYAQFENCINQPPTVQVVAGSTSNNDNRFGLIDSICAGTCYNVWIEDPYCSVYVNGVGWEIEGSTSSNSIIASPFDTLEFCFNVPGTYVRNVISDPTLEFPSNSAADFYVLPCPPQAYFEIDEEDICPGECFNFYNLSQNLISTSSLEVISNNSYLEIINNIEDSMQFCFDETGEYNISLNVSNDWGSSNYQANFFVNDGPTILGETNINYNVYEGDSVNLSTCALGESIEWVNLNFDVEANTESVLFYPSSTTSVFVEVIENECAVFCEYNVNVQNNLLIPTAFSPNSDGVNDFLKILNPNIDLISLDIYNRWGELVFRTNNQAEAWDGIYKGVFAEIGVYMWKCRYIIRKTNEEKFTKGNITLIR